MRPAAEQAVAREKLAATEPCAHRSSVIGRRALLGGAMAASLTGAGVLAVRPPLDLWPSLSEVTSDYRTAKGESRMVKLADASIELNTQTSVSMRPSEDGADLIELVSGEAAVVTKSASARAIAVVAGHARATAADAAFNLRYIGSSGCVSCTAGEVVVAFGNANVRLLSRQQVSYDSRGLQSVVTADMDVVGAWQHGMLVFQSEPLSRVVEEVNRYRTGRIVLMNEDLGRRQVFANFRIDRINDVVPRLQSVFDLRVRSLPGGIVLLS